jgi:hypothetical protein
VLTGEPSTDRSHYAGRDWALNAKRAGVLDKIRFQAFDASKLPFESEAFDAVSVNKKASEVEMASEAPKVSISYNRADLEWVAWMARRSNALVIDPSSKGGILEREKFCSADAADHSESRHRNSSVVGRLP